jgi:hypothetical protein
MHASFLRDPSHQRLVGERVPAKGALPMEVVRHLAAG